MKSLAGVQQLYKAGGGLHGSKQRQHGRAGTDAVVIVPVGTVVHRLRQPGEPAEGDAAADSKGATAGGQQSPAAAADGGGSEAELPEWILRWRSPYAGTDGSDGEASTKDGDSISGRGSDAEMYDAGPPQQQQQQQQQYYSLLADLAEAGQEVVVARGGAGGRGNAGLRAQALAAGETQRGAPGASARLLLELKLLADVGLVGLPNAGKSTLLRALSAATPRVAGYAFTTLTPQLGVVPPPIPGGQPLVLADIPGLVAGAHTNRGLGHRFLRHIERTRALAFVLDCEAGSSAGGPGPRPWEQLALLQAELAAYAPRLAALPALVLANKAETLRTPSRTLAALRSRTQLPVLALSAREQRMLEDGGGGWPAIQSAGSSGAAGRRSMVWRDGLAPLRYRLARLMHDAGAWTEAPVWQEYAAAEEAAAARWHSRSGR